MGTKNVVISAPFLEPNPSKVDHRPRKLVLPVKKKQLTLIMNSKINGKYYHGVLAAPNWMINVFLTKKQYFRAFCILRFMIWW